MRKCYFHLKTLLQSSKAALKFKAPQLVIFSVPLLPSVCLPLEGLPRPPGPSEGLAWGSLLTFSCSTYSVSLPGAPPGEREKFCPGFTLKGQVQFSRLLWSPSAFPRAS